MIQLSTKFGDSGFFIDTFSKEVDTSTIEVKEMNQYAQDIDRLYKAHAPVKPSDYLSKKNIKELEKLLLKLFGKGMLENNLWQ